MLFARMRDARGLRSISAQRLASFTRCVPPLLSLSLSLAAPESIHVGDGVVAVVSIVVYYNLFDCLIQLSTPECMPISFLKV